MKHKLLDRVLLLVFSICALYSGYKLFFADRFEQLYSNDQSVALLEIKENTVKRKSSGKMSWNDAYSGVGLKQKDQIFTYDQSFATITYSNKNKVLLGPNTLYKLGGESSSDIAQVKKGYVYVKLSNEGEDFNIDVGGNNLNLSASNAEVLIKNDGENASVTLLKGKLRIGDQEALGGDVLDIGSEGASLRKINVLPESPTFKEKVFIKNKDLTQFKFKTNKQGGSYEIIIEEDSFFSSEVLRKKIKGEEVALSLPEGDYTWKIRSLQDDSVTFKVPFRVVLDKPPEVAVTENEIYTKVNTADANILWNKDFAQKFLVELSKEGKIFKEIEVEDTRLAIRDLPIGKYQVRVRASDIRNSPWSKRKSISVLKLINPLQPTGLSPSPKEELMTNSKGVLLYWNRDKQAQNYKITIARDQNFEKIIVDELVMIHQYLFKNNDPGKFYWKIEPVNKIGEVVRHQKYSELNFFRPPIEIQYPQREEKIVLERPCDEIDFKWKNSGPDLYTIQISTDKNFSQVVIEQQVTKNSFKWNARKPGKYFYRIKSGSSVFTEPIQIYLDKKQPPKKPIFTNPNEEIELKTKEREFSFLSLFFTEAMAQDTFFELEWPNFEGASKYKLRVYDSSKKKVIFEGLTQNTSIELNAFVKGKIYWQIAVLDEWGQQSPYSDLQVSEIVLSDELVPLTSPDQIYPMHNLEIKVSETDDVKFKWKNVERAKKYILKFSKDLSFKNPVYQKELFENDWSMKSYELVKFKEFYWRIEAINSYGKVTKSKRRKLIIIDRSEKEKEKIKLAIKREKTKKENYNIFLKRRRKRTHLFFKQSLSNVNYELTEGALKVDLSGGVFTSTNLGGDYKISKEKYFLFDINRTSGDTLNGLGYSNTSIDLRYKKFKYLGIQYPTFYTLGVHLDQANRYKHTSDFQSLDVSTVTLFAPTAGVGIDIFSENSNHLLYVSGGFGTISLMEGSYQYKYLWSKSLSLLGGVGIVRKSFSEEEAEISINEMRVQLGLEYFAF